MGEVWRARHRFLARPAAVKLIRPETLGGGDEDRALVALRRFEREAQAIAGLRSPNTIQIYDFGVADDGTFFYVMELLDGLDLETLVERHGPLPQERVVELLLQVCDSLSEAHEQGLLHRDIKPANIFVCRYGHRFDVVKVLDFGLVRTLGNADDARLTREGTLAGTPAYIAPEQAMGDTVDHRADLYSLGCVAFPPAPRGGGGGRHGQPPGRWAARRRRAGGTPARPRVGDVEPRACTRLVAGPLPPRERTSARRADRRGVDRRRRCGRR
jgi:serine/threonine-protein kinase